MIPSSTSSRNASSCARAPANGSVARATMRRSPTQPPRMLDRMVGRDADVEALETELERSRLVTVQGPPGVGKTRLATEIAHRLLARGRGVAHADVTECSTAHDIV